MLENAEMAKPARMTIKMLVNFFLTLSRTQDYHLVYALTLVASATAP
jgi:hypothetical protein